MSQDQGREHKSWIQADTHADAQAEWHPSDEAQASWIHEHETTFAAKLVKEAGFTRSDLNQLAKEVAKLVGRVDAVEASVITTQRQPLNDGAAAPQAASDRYADVPGRLAALESANVSHLLAAESARDVSARVAALESAVSELQAELRSRSGPGGAGSDDASVGLKEVGTGLLAEGSEPPAQPLETAVHLDDPPQEIAGEGDIEPALHKPDPSGLPQDKYDVARIPDAYVLQDSVWDASILLFCRNENGRSLMLQWDVAVLICAFGMNLLFQGIFLAIVKLDMLPDRDFDLEESIGESLEWRAEHGHMLYGSTGMSLIELLCMKSQEDWSYVKDQVLTWQTYTGFYDPDAGESYLIPGKYLSLMSVLLWSMTCMKEYRCVIEQAIGIWKLPLPDGCNPWSWQFGQACFVQEEGEISGEIVSMTKSTKLSLLAIMTFPRVIMLFLLALWGMQFVAETGSLVDLVLNAIALAFVLDIDDYLASMLLTNHVRDCCCNMKPLPCGNHHSGFWAGCSRRLSVLLVLWVTVFIGGVLVYLNPYYSVAQASLDALCEGNKEFIVHGANETVPTTIIVDMKDAIRPDYTKGSSGSKYYLTCEADMENEYFSTYYPSKALSLSATESETVQEARDRAQAITLDFAFLAESIRNPPLRLNLNEEIEAMKFGNPGWGPDGEDYMVRDPDWSAANIQPCPRFQDSYNTGWKACTPMPDVGATMTNCSWTRAADLCDGGPPGRVYRRACDFSSAAAKKSSCEVYASFNTTHPYLSCDKVVKGIEVEMGGSLVIEVAHPDHFVAVLQNNDTILESLRLVFQRTVEKLPDAVAAPNAETLDLDYGLQFDASAIVSGRRLSGDNTTEDDNSTSNITDYYDYYYYVPGTVVLPFMILQAPDTLTTDYMNQANWTLFAENLTNALEALDPLLKVMRYENQTSNVAHAYCSSYIWCDWYDMTLKPNAAQILGSDLDICCDITCYTYLSSEELFGEDIPGVCAMISSPPSETLRSVDDLQATVPVSTNFNVCCEEQLKCDVYGSGRCQMNSGDSVVVLDAASAYQGVQGADFDAFRVCCSLSCLTVANAVDQFFQPRGTCRPEDGLVMVSEPNASQPTIVWREGPPGQPPDYDVQDFEANCCERTTVLCATWDDYTLPHYTQCADFGMALKADAQDIYGEHQDLCCDHTCTTAFWEGLVQCPEGQVVTSTTVITDGDYSVCTCVPWAEGGEGEGEGEAQPAVPAVPSVPTASPAAVPAAVPTASPTALPAAVPTAVSAAAPAPTAAVTTAAPPTTASGGLI